MKILIIGKNGFIAKSLYNLFKINTNYDIIQTSSSQLDFLNDEQVDKFMIKNSFDYMIFTPVYGGRRTKEDNNDIIEMNQKMYNNMLKHKDKFKLIFYFGSGASFDRRQNIKEFGNNKLGNSIPEDPYGFSKYSNEIDIRNHDNIINLRIFNCFGINESIDKGLYLSNIHYLNWSDVSGGRITGLTRYACFWVEGGDIIAPIKTMRFDDSFYRFFGDQLLEVEDKLTLNPEVGTYGGRSMGATTCPGILVDSFRLTL